MTRLQADLLLIVAAAIWGLAFVFQKAASDHVGPMTFIAARGAMAALALAPLAWLEWRRAEKADAPGLGRIALGAGALFFLAGWLQQFGIATTTVTNSSFLTSLYVIFTPLLLWGLTGRAPSALVAVAVALAMAGTWGLGGGGLSGFGTGDALVATSAILWAAHMIATGRSARFGLPLTFTCLQFIVVAVMAGASAMVFETPTVSGLVGAWASILFVGLLSSALTFTLLAVAMKHTPASEAAILVSTETVFAAVAGAVLLGERLPLIGWVGCALMMAATILVQLAPTLDRKRNTSGS